LVLLLEIGIASPSHTCLKVRSFGLALGDTLQGRLYGRVENISTDETSSQLSEHHTDVSPPAQGARWATVTGE